MNAHAFARASFTFWSILFIVQLGLGAELTPQELVLHDMAQKSHRITRGIFAAQGTVREGHRPEQGRSFTDAPPVPRTAEAYSHFVEGVLALE
ncbi:MAG: hypothetical protein CSA62_09060 [Planctomycetota bacterium]|nr:MAG: hypothetical protein CSA62_09060 [Planctomycetota bacterium]